MICRDTSIKRALSARRRQRGFVINPFAFAAGNPPVYKSSALNSIGAVADGDFVLLYLVKTDGAAGTAPTGWTRFAEYTDGHGYGHAIYRSHYAAGNAVANGTNFPAGLGYFVTIVYADAGLFGCPQVGAYGVSAGAAVSITAPALSTSTGAGSALLCFYSSRDKDPMSDLGGMTQRLYSNAPTYFSVAIREQLGVQSGGRTFATIVGSGFIDTANLVEVG